jgi:hypothetical protein
MTTTRESSARQQTALRAAIAVCFFLLGAVIAGAALPVDPPRPAIVASLAIAPLAGAVTYAAIRPRGGKRR